MGENLTGVAASPGIIIGEAMLLEEDLSYEKEIVENIKGEKERLKKAVQRSKEQLASIKEKVLSDMGEDEADIFKAHLMVLEDPELISAVKEKIETEKINAEAALDETIDKFVEMFADMDSEYLKERAVDIQDVGNRVLKNLLGKEVISCSELDKKVVLVAQDLTPSDTAQIDQEQVLGFVTAKGGRTSHTAIMARSMELPAVVGVDGVLNELQRGDQIIVDGVNGKVIIKPTKEEIAQYKAKAEEYVARKKKLAKLKELPAVTKDGHQTEIVANIGTPKDVKGAIDNGAEGIGLYRSEFLYMDRESLPTEEEQFSAYKEVAKKMNGPVIIRTLDVGGDKEIPYLNLPKEMNPFLGYRAIRVCLNQKDMFKTQLRAILRASAYGQVKIMYPMISAVEQLRAANEILAEVMNELREENIDFNADLEVGMMIEVPAAAITADILAKEADFFSIGTNDLIQYTTATDRMNENISHLYQPFHPAVLRLIKRVVDAAHEEGKWAGMCGEMAGDKRLTPYLLGIGLDEFSMSAVSVPEVKETIRNLSLEEAQEVAEQALSYKTAEEIENYLS
ncbi:MAG: phosphoenolpyruvate--protein phosphotransferase [Bacillota bacterium]